MPSTTEAIADRLLDLPVRKFIELLKVVPRDELAAAIAPHFSPKESKSWVPRIQVLKERTYGHLQVGSTREVRTIALERGWIKQEDSFSFKDVWIKVERLAGLEARRQAPKNHPPVPQDVPLKDLGIRDLRIIASQEQVPNWSRTSKLGGGGKDALLEAIEAWRRERGVPQ